MKYLEKLFALAFCITLCLLYACKEDIVSQTLITGKVYNGDSNEGYEGIAVSYRVGTVSFLGVRPFPVLLTYTDSLGNYEAQLPIDEEYTYHLNYVDTVSLGTSSSFCRFFVGEIEKEVDKTVTSQRIDVAVLQTIRCERYD